MSPFLLAVLLSGCGGGEGDAGQSNSPPSSGTSTPTGAVRVDGSSTVFPISEAVAEEFQAQNPDIRVTVGLSGTGGGFQKFIADEIDINDASRPISADEIAAWRRREVPFRETDEFIELPIAYDGLSIVVNADNAFADHLTVEDLRRIWEPNSTVQRWSDIRAGWPDQEIHLYGPGPDSGTFDYFTHAIVGEEGASRSDYTASEDDNTLVQGVMGDENALGYFGYAYYEENRERLKLVPIDAGSGPVAPSPGTITNGTYAPLSRPVFIYVSSFSADRPQVAEFVDYYLDNVGALAREVGYVPLADEVYARVKQRFAARTGGSMYEGRRDAIGLSLTQLMQPTSPEAVP